MKKLFLLLCVAWHCNSLFSSEPIFYVSTDHSKQNPCTQFPKALSKKGVNAVEKIYAQAYENQNAYTTSHSPLRYESHAGNMRISVSTDPLSVLYLIKDSPQIIATHPVETTLYAVAGPYMAAYQLTTVLYSVLDIGITRTYDLEAASEKWADFTQPITDIYTALTNKETTTRDAIKTGTALATSLYAQTKLLGGLQKLCNSIFQEIAICTKAKPTSTPKEYLPNTEAILEKSCINNKNCPTSCVNEYEKMKFALRIEEFTSIIKTTKHGIERLIQRGFTPHDAKLVIYEPSFTKLQIDGSRAFVKQLGDRFNVIVLNEKTEEVITALKNIDLRALQNLGKNYGWK